MSQMIGTRRLNKVRNSLYMYLPREWCDRHSLDKDSEVKLQQLDDGSLLVMPVTSSPTRPMELVIRVQDTNMQMRLEPLLIGAYIVGASRIVLSFEVDIATDVRERIGEWIRSMPGFEILEEYDRSIVISSTSEKQMLIPILKRQFITTKYMLNALIHSFETGEMGDLSRVGQRESDVDRYRYSIDRMCHLALRDADYARRVEVSPIDCIHISFVSKYIERIADHILDITELLNEYGMLKLPSLDHICQLNQLYENVLNMFFYADEQRHKKDPSLLLRESIELVAYSQETALQIAKLNIPTNDVSSACYLVLTHFQRIASYCTDIGEIAIDRILLQSNSSPV